MSEEEGVLQQNVLSHLEAVDLCLSSRLQMPALVLIYSGIDIFAALNRPEHKVDVTRQDFVAWCEQYLVPSGFNQCAPIDLYAARCGVVHTYTSESDLSRKGKAKEVIYAWGDRRPEELQSIIDKVGIVTHAVIHIDDLARSLREATAKFLEAAHRDPNRWALILKRSRKLFGQSREPI